jgi:hypothetical protein
MKRSQYNYSPTWEVIAAWMMGIALAMVCIIIGWLVYEIAYGGAFARALQLIQSNGIWETLQTGLSGFFMGVLILIFLAVAFAALSLPQLLLVALPLAHYLSRGLEYDATRGWLFYILAGATIGGGPWLGVAWLTLGLASDFGSHALLVAPGLGTGILCGIAMQLWLRRLLRISKMRGMAMSETNANLAQPLN